MRNTLFRFSFILCQFTSFSLCIHCIPIFKKTTKTTLVCVCGMTNCEKRCGRVNSWSSGPGEAAEGRVIPVDAVICRRGRRERCCRDGCNFSWASVR